MKVARWGRALAIRLPASLIAELGLHEGDEITLTPTRYGGFDVAFAQRHERSVEWMRPPESIDFDTLQSFFPGIMAPGPAETPPTTK